MSNLKHLLKLFALTCISLISFETAKSANHTVTYPLINNPPGTIVTVGTPTATGTVEALPLSGNFIDYQLKNYLTLSIQPEFNSTEPFELEVDVEITPYNTLNIPLTGLINTQTLKVIYHPYSAALDFSNINTILLQGTHVKFVFEIKAIRKGALGGPLTPISGGELLDNVMVEGKIESNRVYNFNPAPTCNITSINSVDLDCDASSNPDEYEVVWSCSNTSLVEEYQLEWTWTNNYPIPGQPFLTAANVSYNFANCSRVTVGRLTNSYKVSNIYESGFLVFRVRAVGRDMNNPTTIVNGNWNLTNSSGYVANATNSWVLVPEHENNINWQVSTTFAEEGKKKEVVSYFDGAFKNRQAVTKTNTDNDAVVGQSIYDTYGRPAISVLPTPVVGPTICTTPDNTFNPIKYYRNFNRNGNGSPTQYNSSNFDLDGMGPCLSTVQPMNTNSGASKYYSSNNPEKDRQQSFVPEANGYPFSQVEYTPDNTGRIRRQGSVGENYQLEQNKKYTEYYYGQPNQIQLDRLFGSEVGDATHYKKNVIIDPNGQASVTYLNMEGKTVATSLAGDKPQSMEWSATPEVTTQFLVDLFNKNSNGVSTLNIPNANNTALVFNTEILVVDGGEYVFNYNLSIPPFNDNCLVDNVCFDCVYNLQIMIVDECGEVLNPVGVGCPTLNTPVKVGADVLADGTVDYNINCVSNPYSNSANNYSYAAPTCSIANLPKGKYTVYKILTVDEDTRNYYLSQYINEEIEINNCLVDLSTWQDNPLATADITGCAMSCEECVTYVETTYGGRDGYVAGGHGSAEEYDLLIEECNAPCNPKDECDVALQLMLFDVSPNGQYGEYFDQSTLSINSGVFPLSVFNTSDYLAPANSNWKFPQTIDPITQIPSTTVVPNNHYMEEDGTVSKIQVVLVSPGVYFPEVDDPLLVDDSDINFIWTYPENLTNLQDFIAHWKTSWANALVGYHPEFCLYKQCKSYDNVLTGQIQSSSDFDDLLVTTDNLTGAVSAGLLDPVTLLPTFGADPFLTNSDYTPFGSSLSFKLMTELTVANGQQISIYELAASIINCGSQYGTNNAACLLVDPFSGSPQEWTPAQKNEYWNKVKNLYLSEKRKLKEKRYKQMLVSGVISTCGVFNDCIGNDNFSPWTSGMLHYISWSGFFSGGLWGWNNWGNWISAWQSYNAAIAAMPYYQPGSQPCSYTTHHFYTEKQKRFISSEDVENMGDQNSVELQMYYQTGQCPMAFQLQNFLAALASQQNLDNQTATSLQTVPQFSQSLYEVINGNLNPPFNDYQYEVFLTGADIVDINIIDPSPGTNVRCTIHLEKPNQITWDAISTINNVIPSTPGGPPYHFTANADVISGGTADHYNIIGYSTCFNIDGCTFPEQCELNDFGKSIKNLLGIVSATNPATKLITPNLSLATLPLNSSATIYTPLITTSIFNALGAPTATSGDILYNGISTGTSINIEIFYSGTPTHRILLEIDDFDPTSFTNFTDILLLSNFNAANQNGFTFTAVDVNNNTLATCTGTSTLDIGGELSMLPLGDCQVPGPIACETTEHNLLEDLGELLGSVDYTQFGPWDNLNLTTSINFTTLLDAHLPDVTLPLNNLLTTGLNGINQVDTLFLDFDDCIFYLNTGVLDTNTSTWVYNPIENLVSINPPLIPVGVPDGAGNYYSFMAEAVYNISGNMVTSVIYGTSCLPIKSCETCPWDTLPGASAGGGRFANFISSTGSMQTRSEFKKNYEYSLSGFRELLVDYNKSSSEGNNFRTVTSSLNTENDFKNNFSKREFNGLIRRLKDGNLDPNSLKSAINISLNIASVNNSNAYKNGSNSTDAISVCEQNYQLYLIALSNFNASAYAQNHNFNFLPPVANFNDFYNRGFCSCVVLYIAYLNHYINDPVPPIDDAEELHNWSGCTSIKEEPCEIFFQQYKQGVIQYNQWAVSVGYPLLSTSLFVDHKEFYDKGYCFCYEAYNSYLGNYTNGNFPIGSPPADDITFFNGCKEEGVECREEYQQYVHAIDVFNASHPNQTPLIPLHEQLFYILGYCDCVREYIDYLKNLEVGEIAVNIYEWQGCNSTNTECREDWAIYQSTVNHYNATYNANLTIIPEQQFYAAGYCDCVRDYVDYLNNIGNGSAVSINQWEGCNCKEEYTQYAVAVANYNHTYGANVAVMPEAQFYASGYCQCVKDYMTYLNTIGNGNAVSIDVWEGCNPDLCVDLYNAYVAAVNDFNNNHPSNPISQPLSSTVFVNSGYCSCVEDYISYLSSIISNPLAFGLDINVWEGCNSDSCSIAYSNYVNALNTYNNTHNPDLTPITHSVFVNSGYCVCGNNYANYISQLPPSIQGVNINAWAGCNDTCQTIYSNYTTAVNNFNSTHTNPIAAPIAFNTFVNAGYCVCSSNYVTYLASIPTNGYAVNISNWGGCNNDSCSQAYTDYVAALNTYNSNHSPDLVPLAYTPFVNGGYCNCTEDYIAYITQLPPPVVGVNINAWSGCNDPCTVTYNAYVAQVQAYNTSSYATSHGHTLIVLNATTFYNNDYCNCVLPSDSDPNTIDNAGYNAYLNLYITNAVDPLAAPPVSILNWDGCNDEDDCVEWFTTYQQAVAAYQAWQPQQSNPTFPVLNPPAYSYDDFVSANLCNCATGYAAYLNSIVDGLVPLSELNTNHLLVAGYCEDTQPLVTCNNSFPVNPYNPPVIIPENPCDYQIQMNADLNANLLYTQHLQLLTSEFAERYNQHCLGSVTENFTMSYPDREYHFTLYYYDQEGNLVRTVPPEGVQLLDITAPNSPVEIEVIADRTNGTKNVFTDHKLYSTYEYNSLNQLVRQSLPDHDKMNICEFLLPNGLDSRLNITATQFIDANKGYLTGYVTLGSINRGYLYKTFDAGQTWTQVNDLLGADVNKIQMVDASIGYAVCNGGIVLKTTDGGMNWDMLTTLPKVAREVNLVDLRFTSASSGVIIGHSKGVIISTTNGGASFSVGTAITANNYSAITYLEGATANYYFIVGKNTANEGVLLRSAAASLTSFAAFTTTVTNYSATDINKIRYKDATTAYAVGDDGMLYTTTNNGTTWTALNTGQAFDILDSYFKTLGATGEGIAILKNGSANEIWKTNTGGTSWTQLNTNSFNLITPYKEAGSDVKLLGVGNSGRVERVLMTTWPFGTINISPTGASATNLHACATVKYNNGTDKYFAAVAGTSNTLFYCYNIEAVNPAWQQVTLAGVVVPAGQYIKRIILQEFTSNNTLSGVLTLSNGRVYYVRATDFNTTPVFSSGPFLAPFNGTENFADLVNLKSEIPPTTYTSHNEVYGYNKTTSYLVRFTLSSSSFTNTATNVSSSFAANNVNTLAVVPDGTNRNVQLGTVSGKLRRAIHTYNTTTTTISSTNLLTVKLLPLRDIEARNTSNILAVGDNGTMISSSNADVTNVASIATLELENDHTFNINTTNLYTKSGTTFWMYGSDNGKLNKIVSTVGNVVTSSEFTLPGSMSSINDLKSDANGNAVWVGNGGIQQTSSDLTVVNPVITQHGTINSGLNYKGVTLKPTTTDTYIAASGGQMYLYGTGYSMKVNNLFLSKLNDVNFYDGSNGYVVGESGIYRKTSNASASFSYTIPLYNGANILTAKAVHMISSNNAMVAGSLSFIARINNGTFGNYYSNSAVTLDFKDIDINSGNGVVIGSKLVSGIRKIAYYKTYDNGNNWYGINSGSPYNFTTSGSLAAGSDPYVLTSYTTNKDINAVHIFDNKRIAAVGDYSTVMYGNLKQNFPTLNNLIGETFTTTSSLPISSASLKDITFVDDKVGYIVGSTGVSWRTTFTSGFANASTASTLVTWASNCALSAKANNVCNSVVLGSINLTTVNFPSRLDGFIGGSNSACSSNALYAQLYHSESGLYSTRFWYDKLGRLILSQNTKQFNGSGVPGQAGKQRFSYTIYEEKLGRIVEVGEKIENTGAGVPLFPSIFGSTLGGVYNPKLIDDANLAAWLNATSGQRREVVNTYYDTPNEIVPIAVLPQSDETMRKRVSSITYEDVYDGNPLTYQHATHYDYDIHGNVNSLVQDNKKLSATDPNEQYKRLDYEYDLISGKVNKVTYQKDLHDQFIHAYTYDADNRITEVKTSKDNIVWTKDARYDYYDHGPLARIELGQNQVQGVDYAYTLQGWLKGINSNVLTDVADMGKDSKYGNLNQNFGRDAFGYTIGYNNNDYTPINLTNWSGADRFEANINPTSNLGTGMKELFNGNIARTVATITPTGTYAYGSVTPAYALPLGSVYGYDQLNRIRSSVSYNNINTSTNEWLSNVPNINQYETSYTYDKNGNITNLKRKDQTPGNTVDFDNIDYKYYTNGGAKKLQNRLYKVFDTGTALTSGADVVNQLPAGVFDDLSTNVNAGVNNNYVYDEIGNLIKDKAEKLDNIIWRVDGKIAEIDRPTGSGKADLMFDYDGGGNRIAKHEYTDAGSYVKSTYYVRDASGNVMAVYEKTNEPAFTLMERHIYGSSRLGMDVTLVDMLGTNGTPTPTNISNLLGKRQYEISNHLGNVQAVVLDFKIPVDDGSNGTANGIADYYIANIVNAQDYYPFGMIMPARDFSVSGYRYGYNSEEKDDEVKGVGNSLVFGNYGLDVRLGRRWQIDPVVLHDISGYVVFNNNPNFFTDPDGESPISIFAKQVAKQGLKKAAKETVEAAIKSRLKAYMTKGWAKQLASDAADAIDIATSQSWWEYALEVIPIAGDAYGAYKLGEQGYAVYKITQKFESVTEWAGKIVGQAFKKLGPNVLTGKGADRVSFFTKKFNDQGSHLTEDDLAGAVKEIYGLKSGVKANGTPYQHLKEVTEALGGMKKQMDILQKEISSGAIQGDALKAAQGILSDVTKQYNDISNTINSAKKAASNF